MNKIYAFLLATLIFATGSVNAVFDTAQECRQAFTNYAALVAHHRANIGNPAVDVGQMRFSLATIFDMMEQIKESTPAQIDPTLVQRSNEIARSAVDVWIEITPGGVELLRNTNIPASIGLVLPRGRAVPRQLF